MGSVPVDDRPCCSSCKSPDILAKDRWLRHRFLGSSPFERVLYRSARLALYHHYHLSLARIVKESQCNLPPSYVRQLINASLRLLLPPQYKALCQHRITEGSGNVIISFPTSTGKTLLGEMLLVTALAEKPGIVVFLAPYVDLGKQISDAFLVHLPHEYNVNRFIGGFKQSEQLNPLSRMEVIVATPERFDAFMRLNPTCINSVRCVVVDEAHLVENSNRGVRLEGLVSRLRLLQENGHHFRIALLSAVLSDYRPLVTWLGGESVLVSAESWKPTARRIAVWYEDHLLRWHAGDDPLRIPGMTSASVIGELDLPWPETRFYSSSNFGHNLVQEQRSNRNVAYLCDFLWSRYAGPILCVCATRAKSRRLAFAVATRFPLLEPLPISISSIINAIRRSYKYLTPLVNLLHRGVLYHNAGLPHEIRRLLFDAIAQGEIRITVATTTLAEGVDLPFRFTVLNDWLMWQGQEEKPMDPKLFRNIAGRCGRAGVFSEGDTIVYDNPIGDERFTASIHRSAILREQFLDDRPSSIESALSGLRVSEADPLFAELGSQFLAAIPENPDSDHLEATLGEHMLCASTSSTRSDVIQTALRKIRSELLDDTKGAFAQAASPLQLTQFGKAANGTGFSPNSCRNVLRVIQRLEEATCQELQMLSAYLLRELGQLPEQPNDDVRKVLSNPRSKFCVKPEDFEEVLCMWLNGSSREEIFALLPLNRRSMIRPEVDVWLNGATELLKWEDRFDKFCDFVNYSIKGYLPWLFRACGRLHELLSEPGPSVSWNLWADFIEEGVNSPWSIAAVRRNAPGERWAIAEVGRNWPSTPQSESDPLCIKTFKLGIDRELIDAAFLRIARDSAGHPTRSVGDVESLRVWFYSLAGLSVEPLSEW